MYSVHVFMLLPAIVYVVVAMPHTMNLSLAKSRPNICPIVVEYDTVEDRVPRRIKMIRCANEHHSSEHKRHLNNHKSCQGIAHRHEIWSCYELKDSVMVLNKTSNAVSTFEASVGCACVMDEVANANPILMDQLGS